MQISESPVYAFGPFRLDPAERRLLRGDEPVPLPPKLLDTLVALVEADGRLVAKEALMQRLWPDTVVEEVNLARNVSLLRKALGELDDGRGYIETVPKSGYRFIEPVTKVARPADPHGPSVADIDRRPWPLAASRPTSGVAAAFLVLTACIAAIAAWRAGFVGPRPAESVLPQPGFVRATFEGNVVESALSPDGARVASVLRGPPSGSCCAIWRPVRRWKRCGPSLSFVRSGRPMDPRSRRCSPKSVGEVISPSCRGWEGRRRG